MPLSNNFTLWCLSENSECVSAWVDNLNACWSAPYSIDFELGFIKGSDDGCDDGLIYAGLMMAAKMAPRLVSS
jgi:hypothetical protein